MCRCKVQRSLLKGVLLLPATTCMKGHNCSMQAGGATLFATPALSS